MRLNLVLVSVVVFSSLSVGIAHGSIYLDKDTYTWTDKIHIKIITYGLDTDKDFIKIYTHDHELKPYKLSKAGDGLYTGEVTLTGFSHDVDGDGKADMNPQTSGDGPNNGFLETKRDGGLTVSLEFSDGTVLSKSVKISWNEAKLSFDKPVYKTQDSAKIQVTEPDMNLNPDRIDTFDVQVWSDTDSGGIILKVTETDEATGIFDGTITFTASDESSGHRLRVSNGDSVTAKYEDHTLPAPYTITDDLDITIKSEIMELSIHPLKQQMSGIESKDIACKDGFERIFKYDGSPACVKPLTAEKLIQRGWGTLHILE